MGVVCILGGGLQYDSSGSNGIRKVLGANSIASWSESVLHAPLSGLRGLLSRATSSLTLSIPTANSDAADVPWFPANAARTWVGWYGDFVFYDSVATTDAATFRLWDLNVGASEHRYLDVVSVLGSYLLSRTSAGSGQPTYNSTTLTDTRGGFNAVSPDGLWITTSDKKKGKIASHTDTVLTLDAAGWIGGTPTNANNYQINNAGFPKWKFRITDGTNNWDGTARSGVYLDESVWTADFKFTPATVAVNSVQDLYVNGVQEVNAQTGGIGTQDIATAALRFRWSTLDGAKNTGAWGQNDFMFYNQVAYDNISQNAASGWDFNTYPVSYNSNINLRPMVTYRRPKANGAMRYDTWTKSTGSDAGTLIREIRDVVLADFISTTTIGNKQAWSYETLEQCDVPIHNNDFIYAVQSVGDFAGVASDTAPTSVCHSDGANDDAGRNSWGSDGVAALLYCAKKAPDGSDLTYAKADAIQTVVNHTAGAATSAVAAAGQLILFKRGTAATRRPPDNLITSEPTAILVGGALI